MAGRRNSFGNEGLWKSAVPAAGPSSADSSPSSRDVEGSGSVPSCNGAAVHSSTLDSSQISRDVAGKKNSAGNEGFWNSVVPAAGLSLDSSPISRDVAGSGSVLNGHSCKGTAVQSSTQILEISTGKGKLYHWHGVDFVLPHSLCLASGCTLDDDVLQFVGSFSLLKEAEAYLYKAGLALEFDIEDGSLWVTMPSSIFSSMLSKQVSLQLYFWRERMGIQSAYMVSGNSGLIYSSQDPKMLIADTYVFRQDDFLRARQICDVRGKTVPFDLEAMVAFEFVSATDKVHSTWEKCERFIHSGRTKMVVGICDRHDQKQVFLAYKNQRGDLESELRHDPRFVDLGRVLRGFRFYFSYMMPAVIRYFTAHHQFNLGDMHISMRQFELCNVIIQGGSNELAMEITNGLPSVNFIDSAGRTPLVLAAAASNTEIVDFLLANRADPDYCDGDNISAALHAKANGPAQVYDVLRTRRGADFHASIADLLDAIERQQQLRFGMLLEVMSIDGMDINASEQVQGYTALSHAASTSKWTWAVAKLIEKGACPTMADSHSTIPLVKAIVAMTPTELKESKILEGENMDYNVVHLCIQLAGILGLNEVVQILMIKSTSS